jgi:SAM-dependent methyltransferase
MYKYINNIVWYLTQGAQKQSYLGAKWVLVLLKLTPVSLKRRMALIILSLSPHYFFRYADEKYDEMPYFSYLESEYTRNKTSRKFLFENILNNELICEAVVIDYGCGAGFLAKAVAPHVKKVFAVDVSMGVLSCAKILNELKNIHYIHTSNVLNITDGSVDLVYSFAVIQHVDEITFQEILTNISMKLKAGGRAIIHIVLSEPGWKSESEWRSDETIQGKLKINFGLYCFSREEEGVTRELERRGFQDIIITKVSDRYPNINGDLAHQHVIFATRSNDCESPL